jgi:hypothetical protein
MLLPFAPLVFRKRPPRPKPRKPAALVLTQASYSPSPKVLWLYFDREIDVTAIDGEQIFVNDGDLRLVRMNASGGVLSQGPMVVSLQLVEIEPFEAGGIRLTATAGNGIVAVNDQGAWAGCEHLGLPFP